MTDVFLERSFDPPLTPELVVSLGAAGAECFDLHRVDWLGSLLATDGRRMVCRFRGPDAESARTALRQVDADVSVMWPGSIHLPPPTSRPGGEGAATVMVTRRFGEPVTVESIQAIEDTGAWCLEARGVEFLRTFFSRDRKRMLCVYRAPDAEAVRQAQRQAGMPVEDVWACRFVHPTLTELPAP